MAKKKVTKIEVVVAALQKAGFEIDEILIPEQCALVYAPDGTCIHVIASDGPDA